VQVEFLAATWEQAVSHRYLGGKACGTFRRRGGVLGSEHFDMMVEAAGCMLEHEIAPAAWLAFSFDVWDEQQCKNGKGRRRKLKPPPLTWAYSPDRLNARRGWFRTALANLVLGGQLTFLPAHRELVGRHARMRAALLRMQNPTNTEVAAVVARFFPDGCYAQLAERACNESKAQQVKLKRRAARGEWIW
jgi:hypothetical protein